VVEFDAVMLMYVHFPPQHLYDFMSNRGLLLLCDLIKIKNCDINHSWDDLGIMLGLVTFNNTSKVVPFLFINDLNVLDNKKSHRKVSYP
jgi:hypothetical protein